MRSCRLAWLLTMALGSALGQGTSAAEAAKSDTSYIEPNGTAHITRVVPVPPDLSPEAKKMVGRVVSDAPEPDSLQQRRTMIDTWQAHAGEVSRGLYPVNLTQATIAGVPVRVVAPTEIPAENRGRLLINLHGGGFNADSGSLTESIPIANLTRMKVVSVLYRLAPEHPFPADVEDVVAVYKESLKTYRPEHIGIYGTSAGAILTAEVAVRLKQLGVPLPAALGVFSGTGDLSRSSDSVAMYALQGLSGHLDPPQPDAPAIPEYIGKTDPRDPVLSPLFADLHGMPPALFITSGRDLLLSGTTILHRAFLRADVDAELVVFEGLPHAFWNDAKLPETKEAYGIMSSFFVKKLNQH